MRPSRNSTNVLNANPNIQQKRLSPAVKVVPSNLAVLLAQLEGGQLIRRQINLLDKRSQTLRLTERGAALCDQAEHAVCQLELAASVNLTDTERAELLRLLQKIS